MKCLPMPEYDAQEPRFRQCTDTEKLIKEIQKHSVIAIDTETYYDPSNDGVIRFIGSNKNNVPFGLSVTMEYDKEYISYWVTGEKDIKAMRPILEDEAIAKILHNSKYDMHMLSNYGLEVKGTIWDTMVMIHLIDEEHMCKTPDGKMVMSKALKNLAYHYLGEDGHVYENLVDDVRRVIAANSGRLKGAISYKEANDAAPLIMKDYACSDTEFTFRLWRTFLPEIQRQNLEKAYEIDINATRAVFEMERVGLGVDMEYYKNLEDELTITMHDLMARIHEILPLNLNIRSGRDLVTGFQQLGVDWVWYTEKGEVQTDTKVLQQFKEGVPGTLAGLILDYREAAKLRDTFITQICSFTQGNSIHADFNICPRDDSNGGTVTGRLSSNNPNLHNLPKDDTRIRKGIVPREGFVFVEMDYDFDTLVVVKAH